MTTRSLHPNLGRISASEARHVAKGFFLGATWEFWLVLGTCLSSILLCFVISVGAVELQTRRRGTQERRWGKRSTISLLEPLLRKPPDQLGLFYRMVFKASFRS